MSMTARNATAALLATGLFAFSSAAMATNGYFTHGVGTESKGMAGSGVASPADMGAITVATNPALGVFADDKWQIGLAVFSPMRSYDASASPALAASEFFGEPLRTFTLEQGKYDSKNEAFPIPYVAKNWKFSNGNALSFVFYGRGGMNTEWEGGQRAFFDPAPTLPPPFAVGTQNPPGVFGGGTAGVDLMQAFLSLNYAWKISDSFAIGFGPVAAVQLFEATGLGNFAPYTKTFADAFPGVYLTNVTGCVIGGGKLEICQAQELLPSQAQTANGVTKLTNNGSDMSTGYGGAIGVWGGTERFSYGFAYQSKLSMSEFEDYADLYAERGGFDIPSTLKAGVSFTAGETARINLDVEHIKYTDVDSVSNSIANLIAGCYTAQFVDPPESSGCLGGPSGAGFGWEDVTVYKAGIEWASNDNNTWRVGYSYGEQPIPSTEVLFNILAPGVMEHHMTVGWTNRRSNGNVLSMSLMYAPKKTIKGTSTFDPTQVITLEMQQLEFEIAYRF